MLEEMLGVTDAEEIGVLELAELGDAEETALTGAGELIDFSLAASFL